MGYTKMKSRIYLWLVALSLFTSCVDGKYNLGDIDTDNVVVGDEWIMPLGTVDVKVTDVVDLDRVQGLKIEANGDYRIAYTQNINVPSIPNVTGVLGDIHLPIPSFAFEVGDLSTMFGSDFTLGLANPYITLVAEGLKGAGTIDATMRLTASKRGAASVSTNTSFLLSKAKPKVWIGPWKSEDASYSYVENTKLPELIVMFPQQITVETTRFVFPAGEVTALDKLKYALELPFIPSGAFNGTATQSLKDIFDDSLVDYAFSSGSTTILGTVTNQLPFDADITLSVTDLRGKTLIALPKQSVKGDGVQPVSFEITEKEMPKMKSARNIELKFDLKGRADNRAYLNKNQEMKMALKLLKKGGIKVEL